MKIEGTNFYLEAKERLDAYVFKKVRLGSVLSGLIIDHALKRYSLKYLCAYFFLSFDCRDLDSKLFRASRDIVFTRFFDREDHEQLQAATAQELFPNEEIDFVRLRVNVRPDVRIFFKETFRILEISQFRNLGVVALIYSFWKINFYLRMIANFEKRVPPDYKPVVLAPFATSQPPEAILAQIVPANTVCSYQHGGNLCDEKEFSDEYELFLNLNCDSFYCWGTYYQEIIERYNPNLEVKIIGNPLFKTITPLEPIEHGEISFCLYLNSVKYSENNIEMIRKCNTFGSVNIKKHPQDKTVYPSTINSGTSDVNPFYVVNNSTSYLNLIASGKNVLMYISKRGNNFSESYPFEFVFSETEELGRLIKNFDSAVFDDYRRKVLRDFYCLYSN
jgi:hypothetical protein